MPCSLSFNITDNFGTLHFAHCSTAHLSPPSWNYFLNLDRRVPQDEIVDMKLDKMPGFRFSWNYDKEIDSEARYINDDTTKEFVR